MKSTRPKRPPNTPHTISQHLDLPGARPATFKLIERAEDSFYLYRSSKKLGTARVEENGEWTARIGEGGKGLLFTASSDKELLNLVGGYLLAGEARDAIARPVEETNPELRIKGKKSPDERLSIEFAKRAQAARLADLDEQLALLKRSIKRAPKS